MKKKIGINFQVSSELHRRLRVTLAMRGELMSEVMARLIEGYIGDQSEQERDLAEFVAAHKAQTISQEIEAAR